jgi:hypothetical protein
MENYVMRKPEKPVLAAGKVEGAFPDEGWLKRYPTLCQYMTDAAWDDGTARECSQLSISCREGDVCLALNDKDLQQSLYTAAESVTEALKLMEGALADGRGQWRPWKTGKKANRRG